MSLSLVESSSEHNTISTLNSQTAQSYKSKKKYTVASTLSNYIINISSAACINLVSQTYLLLK